MKKLYTLLGMVGLIAFSSTSNAQCANDNTLYLTVNAANLGSTGTIVSTCTYGGEYNLITNMQAGDIYTFETCGDTDFDTQLTIFNDATGAVVAYNDDNCGLQSSVTFTSDGSSVRVSLDRFNCQDEATCMTILGSVVAGNVTPCDNILPLACDIAGSFTLSGTGQYAGNGPWSTPGAEQIYSFTAPTTGSYTIDVSHSGGGWVDLFSRTAASGCSGSGWTYIDDVLGSATNTVNLVAGTSYYFMLDDENTTTSAGSITINCPSGVDPCDDITDLDGCAVSKDFTLSGSGAFNGNGPWNTPGAEAIYSYTPPFSGDYEIGVSFTGGSYIDLFFTEASNGCSGSGWTYVDDVLGSATNFITLVGGTTYYFMLDDENTTANDGTITIDCPCIISTLPDASYTYNGPFVISGTTDDACSDCSIRPSEDRIYEIEIPCAGTYTFETCGSSFDTYLYLTDAFCGNVLASNDDSPCGGGFSLQSSITATLAPGTYFISVEAFSQFTTGAFDLAVSGTEDPIQLAIVSTTDVTCFGGSDGSATAEAQTGTLPFNFVWSDGQMMATASGLSAGSYTVGGTDANGCVADDISVTINQPDLIEANVSPQNHVIDCVPIPVDLSANPTGGAGGPYTYLWSTGETTASISVNPNVTTTYSVSVTDANGCTENMSTNSTTVTVINRCGNNNQKSVICHVPSGNNGNPQTICISPNALNAHLATLWNLHGGDYCGPCASNSGTIITDNTNLGDNSFIRAGMNINTESVDVSYRLAYDSKVRIEIYDMAGVLVDVIFEGQASEGQLYDLRLQTDKISSGVYIYQFITDRETHIDKLQIIQ